MAICQIDVWQGLSVSFSFVSPNIDVYIIFVPVIKGRIIQVFLLRKITLDWDRAKYKS